MVETVLVILMVVIVILMFINVILISKAEHLLEMGFGLRFFKSIVIIAVVIVVLAIAIIKLLLWHGLKYIQ